MRYLIEKELNLNIPKFYFIMPILAAALMMIPMWIYVIVFMYFFWISIPAIYAAYNQQNDLSFTTMLPVRKKDIVISKITALVTLELLHIILGFIMAIVHNQVYGTFNIFLELNIAFFGMIFILFSIFNIIFLPGYFKTAYQYGKPLLISSIAITLYGASIELLNVFVPKFHEITHSPNYLFFQWGILIVGIISYVLSILFSTKLSIKRFEERL